MASREFAWLDRRNGIWHLTLMLDGMRIREVATYVRPKQAMRHVDRWIASRWQRTVRASGADDPMELDGRERSHGAKHWLTVELWRMGR